MVALFDILGTVELCDSVFQFLLTAEQVLLAASGHGGGAEVQLQRYRRGARDAYREWRLYEADLVYERVQEEEIDRMFASPTPPSS